MPITTRSTAGTPSISAMELRKQPGTFIDRVFYRNESFIIERAGEPKAAIVPLSEFEKVMSARKEARKRLFARIDKIRKAAGKKAPEEIEKVITEAVRVSRKKLAT